MMLSAGREVLLASDPTLSFDQLTYSLVFEHLMVHHDQKVTIGSVHERIWASQREFQLDVVKQVLNEPIDPGSNQAFAQAAELLGKTDLSTPAGRRYALQTAIRLSSLYVTDEPFARSLQIAHMVRFRLGSLDATHSDTNDLRAAIFPIRELTTRTYAEVVRDIIEIVGGRVRTDAGDPDDVFQSIALLSNAVSVGLRSDVLPQASAARQLPTGPDGQHEPWYPDSVALWAFTRASFELDGDDLTPDERRL